MNMRKILALFLFQLLCFSCILLNTDEGINDRNEIKFVCCVDEIKHAVYCVGNDYSVLSILLDDNMDEVLQVYFIGADGAEAVTYFTDGHIDEINIDGYRLKFYGYNGNKVNVCVVDLNDESKSCIIENLVVDDFAGNKSTGVLLKSQHGTNSILKANSIVQNLATTTNSIVKNCAEGEMKASINNYSKTISVINIDAGEIIDLNNPSSLVPGKSLTMDAVKDCVFKADERGIYLQNDRNSNLEENAAWWEKCIVQCKQLVYEVVLSTGSSTAISFETADCSFLLSAAKIMDVTDGYAGIIYSWKQQDPLFDEERLCNTSVFIPDNRTYVAGQFKVHLENLKPNTEYYYKAFWVYRVDGKNVLWCYSNDVKSFSTKGIETGSYSQNSRNSVVVNGEVRYNDEITYNLFEYGICYSKDVDTEIGKIGTKTVVVSEHSQGPFSVELNDLELNEQYYYKAFICYDGEVKYGEQGTFSLNDSFYCSPSAFSLTSKEQQFDITVKSEYEYSIFYPQWIEYISYEPIDDYTGTLHFRVAWNVEKEARDEFIIFVDKENHDLEYGRVSVTQMSTILGSWACDWTGHIPPNIKLLSISIGTDGSIKKDYLYQDDNEYKTYIGRYAYEGDILTFYQTNGIVQVWRVDLLNENRLRIVASDGFSYNFKR